MQPVRVLQVVPAMECGGMETFIMNVYRNIDRSKVQFDFLYHYVRPGFYDREIESLGGKIYRLPIREDNNFPQYFRQLDEFFREHTEYRVIHGHYSGFGMFYNHYAKKHGITCRIGHCHSDKYEQGLIGQLDRFMSKPFRYGLTQRYACSETAGRFLYGKKPFKVLVNGISAERFAFSQEKRQQIRREYGIPENAVVIGHVGRFAPVKNHKFLIDCFADFHSTCPESRLLLVGTGDEKNLSEARDQVRKAGLEDSVIFAGLQNHTEDFLCASDVFCLPSLFEGIPLCLVEAQANGLICLASDAVNPASDVTGNVRFLPLEAGKWVEQLRQVSRSPREDSAAVLERIRQSGYDITTVAAYLQSVYLEEYEKNGRPAQQENP